MNHLLEKIEDREIEITLKIKPKVTLRVQPVAPVEVWKQYNGGRYEASNLGNIRRDGLLQKVCLRKGGYLHFRMSENGKKSKHMDVHRIVCELFCEGKSNIKNSVDHIDRITTNNCAANLRWYSALQQANNTSRTKSDGLRGSICKCRNSYKASFNHADHFKGQIQKYFPTRQEAEDCLADLRLKYPEPTETVHNTSPVNVPMPIADPSPMDNAQTNPVSISLEVPTVNEPVITIADIDTTECVEWHSQQIPIPIADPIEKPVTLITIPEGKFRLCDLPYENPRTKANVVSTINQMNKFFAWDAKILHYDLIEANPNAVVDYVRHKYVISSISVLRTKLLSICGAMHRCVPNVTSKLALLANTAERKISVPIIADERIFPDWQLECLPSLQEIAVGGNKICAIIAKCFLHGYVFRLSVIFNTKYGPNQGELGVNYLDTVAKVWHLGKIKSSKPFSFAVSDDFLKGLKPVVGEFMFNVPDQRRVNPSLGVYNWTSYTNNELRHSYEVYNTSPSTGRSISEQELWHQILGHTRQTALEHYVPLPTDNDSS